MRIEQQPLLEVDPEVVLESAVNEAYEQVVVTEDEDEHDEDVIELRQLRQANKALQWFRRPSVLMISVVTFLLAFATSSGESTRQVIQYKLACNSLTQFGEKQCEPVQTQILISNFQIATTISTGIFSSIAAGKIGPLSDIYGRKPFIIAIACMFAIGRTCKFAVMYKFNTFQFGLMVGSDIVASLCGGILSLVAIMNCYISDVVEVQDRIHSLGIGFSSLFLGLSTGPLVGNLLMKLNHESSLSARAIDTEIDISANDYLPLKFELAVFYLVILYTIFLLPESRSEKARLKSRTLSVTSVAIDKTQSWADKLNFLKPLKLLIIPQELKPRLSPAVLRKQRLAVLLLVVSECIVTSMAIAMGEVFILYGLYKFNWDSSDIGHLLAASCSSKAVALIVLSPLINHKLLQDRLGLEVMKKQYDMIDFSMAFVGMSLESILYIFLGLAPTDSVFLLCIVLTCLGSITSPTINSAIVKFYPESKFGEIFGALALLKNLSQLVGPFTFLTIYKTSLSKWDSPEFVFYFAGGLFGIVALNQLIVKRVLNLYPCSVAIDTESSSCSLTNYFAASNGSNSSDTPPVSQDDTVKYTELHRKNSFVYNERSNK